MINPKLFCSILSKHNINFYSGVPDSLLKGFCNYIYNNIDSKNHIISSNEGAAIAIGTGYHLSTGEIPFIYMQNSGLGNAINPLLSLIDKKVYSIPMLILLGWRGYSGNKGNPSELNLYKDAESALNWIDKNTSLDKKNIILYGESLGSGVAVELGTKYRFKSIILEAPFTSIPDIAQKRYFIFPVRFLVLDKFDNLSKINKVFSPLLIISGKKDEVVPHEHSKKLFLKANEPKETVFIDEAMHNNLYDFEIEKNVIQFSLKQWK